MARSPFVVDITPLKRTPGMRKRFEESLPPPTALGLESAAVESDRLHIDLQLEVAGEELIAQGSIRVDWSGPCRRCLERHCGSSDIELREIFQKSPSEGETYPLDEDEVDLEPMVREQVLLYLPVAPLCSELCAGPDPDRFPTTVVPDEDPDVEPPADPRWAALSELHFDN